MKKKLSKFKKLSVSFIIIALIILLLSGLITYAATIIGGSTGKKSITISPGKEFRIRFSTVFRENKNVYCAELGQTFSGTQYFTPSKLHKVTDPILAYILNLPDVYKTESITAKNGHGQNLKQNLIWWYIENYNTSDAKFIGSNLTKWPNKNTLSRDDIKTEIDKAKEYAKTLSNVNISIDQMEIEDSYLNVTISGNCTKFKVYCNGTYYDEYDKSSDEIKTISILLESLENKEDINIEVKAVGQKFSASIYRLDYTGTGKGQRLLYINSAAKTTEVLDSDSKIIYDRKTNVSLQKYITRVTNLAGSITYDSSERKDKILSNQSADSGYTDNISNNTIVSNSIKKNENPVTIEPGDTVTYNVIVYNNSEKDAKVTVADMIPNTNINSIRIAEFAKDYTEYETDNENYEAIYLCQNMDLAAGESKTFTVEVKFNVDAGYYIDNTAWILDTNPDNETDYRTLDKDYITMQEYSVSLEKYITRVESKNIPSQIDIDKYSDIISYLKNHNISIDRLINDYSDKTIIFDEKYDLNSDKKINVTDYNIFMNYKNIVAIEEIDDYIKYDLNHDGLVNEVDLNIYKLIKTDLNGDDKLDRYDRYIYILKRIYEDDKFDNSKILNYLYSQRLLINKSVEQINEDYDNYIKSDVDENGYVTQDDDYVFKKVSVTQDDESTIEEMKLFIKDEEYSYKISNEIDELEDTQILKEYLSKYDINHDTVLDTNDITLFENYINTNQYDSLKAVKSDKFEEFKQTVRSSFVIKLDEFSKYNTSDMFNSYDINYDEQIDYYDYLFIKEEFFDDLKSYLEEMNNLIDEKLKDKADDFDFNKDGSVNFDDYKIFEEYCLLYEFYEDGNNEDNIIDTIQNIIEAYNVFDTSNDTIKDTSFSNEDINVIKVYKGLKEYNEEYNISNFDYDLYDINRDSKVNSSDKELFNNSYAIFTESTILSNIINASDIEEFIETCESNTKEDMDKIVIDTIIAQYSDLVKIINDSVSEDVSSILKDETIKDLSNITYGNIKEKTELEITNLDADKNGIVNEADKEFASNIGTQIEKEEITEFEYDDVVTKNDINDDGQVDNSDIVFFEHLKEISESDNIKNAIKNADVALEGDITTIAERENKRHNDTLPDGDKNKNQYKVDNKVSVEVGDIVRFTIKLTNTTTEEKPVKITEITDTYTYNNDIKLEFDSDYGIKGNGGGTYSGDEGNFVIKFEDAVLLDKDESVYVTLQFKVNVSQNKTSEKQVLENRAEIQKITNKNGYEVTDSDGTDNNADKDFVITKIYQVSLEKYVAKVERNGNAVQYNRAGNAEHKYDDNTETNDSTKANSVVTVGNGDKVTYIIKVTNNSQDTGVYITEITDYLPNGVKYENKEYTGDQYDITKQTENIIKFSTLKDTYLRPGEFASFEITVEVIEPNMSVNILRNVAEITGMKNKNEKPLDDSTQNNNKDADYIQMKDIIISGTVWNDLALNKTQDNYNGLYDLQDEAGLSGIEVKLYRVSDKKVIATTHTDSNGYYKFDFDYIKGSKVANTNRWAGTYHSYYIIFEYDGITYTSTPDGRNCQPINSSSYKIDSNAKEDNNLDQNIGVKSREDFNNSFSTINNTKGISYTTKNETEYIPQSNHLYNSSMDMQSSTNLINIGEYTEDELQYIGLGLKGRDIFDLELVSAVDQIKITVNNEQGVYRDTNTASFRTQVTSEVKEDMANVVSEKTNTYLNNEEQEIRESDYNVDTEKAKYSSDQGISHVEVKYKITIQNTSLTKGRAAKITNYYDSKYTFVGAYSTPEDAENYVKELTSNNVTGDKYGYVTIDTPSNMLSQSDIMEIYVVYTLNNPSDNLKDIDKDNPFVTLNMAEITEYKTECADGQTEYTRGLIDKDSAPGSVNREQVRLTTTEGQNTATTGGNPTTLEYYFNKLTNENISNSDYLKVLKYEDDTYATPVIFKAAMYDNGTPDNPNDDTYSKRTIKGTVFEDYTRIIGDENEDIRIKTGDGIQDTTNNVEPGVQGITVGLYEMVNNEPKLRFTATTDKEGKYTFEGYLPGNYIVKYEYGDTNATFLLNNDPNTKSYNGEDFQSTNNTGSYESNKLDEHDLTWYIYNEEKGISTATDSVNTRQTVSTKVTSFSDEQMTVLNNARDGMSEKDAKVGDVTVESIREATQMDAKTKSMKLTMEKTVLDEKGGTTQNTRFADYNVGNMNFGIAEVPVTTIDMQKHVHSFTIVDSTGSNVLAGAKVDTNNTSVVVNASKIAVNRLDTVINVLSENLGISKDKVRKTINYDQNKSQDINITIAQNVNEESKNNLKNDMTKYSLAREIKILYGWKVTAGNVIAAPGTQVLDVSIEDEKLQGAKLEITYEVSANIYAEKNFNSEAVTVPTIEGMVDYIDNDLSYDENKNTVEGNNSKYWSVTTYDAVQQLFEGQGNGTLDSEGKKYSTIIAANEDSEILQEKCGEGTVYITLEKVLSSSDSTLADIILNTVDSYEYSNTIEITKLNYENQVGTADTGNSGGTDNIGGTGGSGDTDSSDGENGFVFKDRVRTPDRFIIIPGMSHDYESSETISIHPPTGDSSIDTSYYIIAAISLVVVVAGIFGIKRFVIKK